MSQFIAESRKAFAAGIAAAVTVLASSGKLDNQTIAGAVGAFVAAAILVYLVPNRPAAQTAPAASPSK